MCENKISPDLAIRDIDFIFFLGVFGEVSFFLYSFPFFLVVVVVAQRGFKFRESSDQS